MNNSSAIPCESVKYDRSMTIVFGIACLFLSFLASIGNLASLIYVKLNWNLNNKKRSNYTHQMTMVLVTNIALTDLLNGMFSASFNAANFFRQAYPEPETMVMTVLCNFCGLIHFLTTRASILLMCVLSVFRYIAISKPILFNNHNSKKVLTAVLCVVWSFVLLMAFLPYYFNTKYIYFQDVYHCTFHWWQLKDGLQDMCKFLTQGAKTFPRSVFFALFILPIHGPGFAMIFFTILILARLGKLHHKMKHGKGPRRSSDESLHAKAAHSTLQILIFFVFTYAPWWIVSLIHFLDMHNLVPKSCPSKMQFWRCVLDKEEFALLLFVTLYLMIYLNAAINPFIYYYRLFKRSEAMKKANNTRLTSNGPGNNGKSGAHGHTVGRAAVETVSPLAAAVPSATNALTENLEMRNGEVSDRKCLLHNVSYTETTL